MSRATRQIQRQRDREDINARAWVRSGKKRTTRVPTMGEFMGSAEEWFPEQPHELARIEAAIAGWRQLYRLANQAERWNIVQSINRLALRKGQILALRDMSPEEIDASVPRVPHPDAPPGNVRRQVTLIHERVTADPAS